MVNPPLPGSAAWQHLESRTGFEVATFRGAADGDGIELTGTTAAVEDGIAWTVGYRIRADGRWRTREALVHGRSARGELSVYLLADGAGHWLVDGAPAAHLDGCLDVDLESSAVTNTLPVRRLALRVGEGRATPAAYVRALDLRVERLEQSYARLEDGDHGQRYGYAAPVFDFSCELAHGEDLLVQTYPGIARRVAVDQAPDEVRAPR